MWNVRIVYFVNGLEKQQTFDIHAEARKFIETCLTNGWKFSVDYF